MTAAGLRTNTNIIRFLSSHQQRQKKLQLRHVHVSEGTRPSLLAPGPSVRGAHQNTELLSAGVFMSEDGETRRQDSVYVRGRRDQEAGLCLFQRTERRGGRTLFYQDFCTCWTHKSLIAQKHKSLITQKHRQEPLSAGFFFLS